jgi:hypothetical protein
LGLTTRALKHLTMQLTTNYAYNERETLKKVVASLGFGTPSYCFPPL